MRRYSLPLSSLFLSALIVCVVFCLLAIPPESASGQAVSPSGNLNPAAEPLAGQTLGTDLTLNQGVNAINAENESFDRFGLGLQGSGGVITDFFGTKTNQVNAGYAQVMGDAGVLLRSSRTRYFALYQPQYNIYPQYSQVNSYTQTFFQTLTHHFTERTGIEWNTTGARYLSLNEYLPQVLGIGGVGIVVPTPGQQLLEDSFQVTNAATSLHVRDLISERMTLDATVTGAFFLIVPHGVQTPGTNATERFITSGGDLQLTYQLNPRVAIGGEVTPIYTYGLFPNAHQVVETAQAIYQRQLTATLVLKVGAGPLFAQSSSPDYGSVQANSYAVNASLTRQVRQSQFSLAYQRTFLVNLLQPAAVSNTVGANAYLPFHGNWVALGGASFTHDAGNKVYGAATVFGGSAQIAYLVAPRLQLFARYSVSTQRFNTIAGVQAYDFTRNQISGGIRFNLGNPFITGGIQ